MRLQIAECRLQIGWHVSHWPARCCSVGAALRADEIIDRVLAVVAGDLIMMSDVRAARELGLIDPGRASRSGPRSADAADRPCAGARRSRSLSRRPSRRREAIDRSSPRVRQRVSDARGVRTRRCHALGHATRIICARQVRQDLRIRAYLDQRFASENARAARPSDRRVDRRPAPPRDVRRYLRAGARDETRRRVRASAVLFRNREERRDLQQVEARVADHRRDARSAPQVDQRPERAEQRRSRSRRRRPATQCPAPNAMLVTTRPTAAPPSQRSKRCSRKARCISSRTPPAMTTTIANSRRRAASRSAPAAGCARRCAATVRAPGRTSMAATAITQRDEDQRHAAHAAFARSAGRRRTLRAAARRARGRTAGSARRGTPCRRARARRR